MKILGYTGKIDKEEMETLNSNISASSGYKEEYSLNDVVGKTGIEETMEDYLRGVNGKETIYVDNMGK